MIVLDTHIWIWWVNQEQQFKSSWRSLIETSAQVGVSAISCFEVAWLAHHDRIDLSYPLATWFQNALNGSGIELLAITPEIASRSVVLPEHHSDPQDRLIIATAIANQAKLISADTKFPLYTELSDLLIR